MRIASKINIALIGVLMGGIIASYAVLNATVLPKFEELENQAANANHKRVLEALDTFTDKLETASHDYAFWDETHKFVQDDSDQAFIDSNLSPEFNAVENLGINVLVFMRKDGTVRWSSAYDLETGEKLPEIAKEIAQTSQMHRATDGKIPDPVQGIVKTSRGLTLIAIAPVLKSDGTGPVVGSVASAKFLSTDSVRQLTGVKFELTPEVSAEASQLSTEAQISVGKSALLATSLIRDINQKPLAVLVATTARDISYTGMKAIKSALLLMLTGGIIMTSVLWYFLRHQVVEPLQNLRTHFSTAGSDGLIKPAELTGDEDEIYDLAKSFNNMADQVNLLRDTLADNAYMTGLSEWGAGTLHNVRNGLAPVATSAWGIQQNLNSGLLANMQSAAVELKSTEPNGEREAALKDFLALGTAELADSAKQSRLLTNQINESTKAVLDMVSEFERYAKRETQTETLELKQVVDSVLRSASLSGKDFISVELSDADGTFVGNGVILRQIVLNILTNATEAMHALPADQWQLKISSSAVNEESDHITLEVTDNGVGIAPENMQRLFTKGFSSKARGHRGVGLHWCANAIKVMGGTISLHSDGENKGTSARLRLPRAVAKRLEKAA